MHCVKFSASSKALAPAAVYKFIQPPVPTGDCCSPMTCTVAAFTVAFQGQCFSECHTPLKPLMPGGIQTRGTVPKAGKRGKENWMKIHLCTVQEEQVRSSALLVSLRTTSKEKKTILTYLWPQQKKCGGTPYTVREQQL